MDKSRCRDRQPQRHHLLRVQFYQHQPSGTHHGPVNLSDTGAIDSYTVTQGKITIGDKGMDASTNYAALLADAIAINGTVTAANAKLGAGNFTFDNNTGKIATPGKRRRLCR